MGLRPRIKLVDNVAFTQANIAHQVDGIVFNIGGVGNGGTDLDDFSYRLMHPARPIISTGSTTLN